MNEDFIKWIYIQRRILHEIVGPTGRYYYRIWRTKDEQRLL